MFNFVHASKISLFDRKEHKLGFLDNVYIIITVFVYMLTTFERKIIVFKKLVM